MASTNKTTNYELSQYIGTDKPTYLTDYNQDMSKIDAGIHAAKSEADTNTGAIGTLSNLTTTTKTSLVAAINELDSDVGTNTSNISDNTSNIATNTAAIGTLSNLTTTTKTSLVAAANEINAKAGDLSNLTTTAKTSLVAAINEIVNELPDVYESQEHITNKVWIDGKPVYRKVISGNVAGGNQWYSIDVSSLNIDHLEDLHMKFLSSNNEEQYFNNFYVSEAYRACTRYNKGNNSIQYNIGSGYATGSTFNITIEYTKTTD